MALIEFEREKILAIALNNPAAMVNVFKSIEPSWLFPGGEAEKEIWNACKELHEKGADVSILSVLDWMRRRDDDGLHDYLEALCQVVWKGYEDKILQRIEAEQYALRLDKLSFEFAEAKMLMSGEIQSKLSSLMMDLASLQLRKNADLIDFAEHFKSFWQDLQNRRENKIDAPTTGFRALDAIGPYGLGRLITLAAGTGGGKTLFAINLALNIARQGRAVYFFSLEMSSRELMERIVSNDQQVEHWKFKNPSRMNEETLQKVAACEMFNFGLPLLIYAAQIDVDRLIFEIRDKHAKTNLELVVLDYLQLVDNTESDDMRSFISRLTRKLKLLAIELNICILMLSQLRRGYQDLGDRRPRLHDLKESSSIEADSDAVLLLYKEDENEDVQGSIGGEEESISRYARKKAKAFASPKSTLLPGELELTIAKNRHGRKSKVIYDFKPEYCLITEKGEMS